MEEQTVIILAGMALTVVVSVAAGVFGLMAYINRQDERLREYVDAKLEAFKAEVKEEFREFRAEVRAGFAELRGDVKQLGETLYGHNRRISRLEAKVEGSEESKSDDPPPTN